MIIINISSKMCKFAILGCENVYFTFNCVVLLQHCQSSNNNYKFNIFFNLRYFSVKFILFVITITCSLNRFHLCKGDIDG